MSGGYGGAPSYGQTPGYGQADAAKYGRELDEYWAL